MRKHLPTIVESAKRQDTLSSVFGADNLLGDIHEDEAVVGQVRLLLKEICEKMNATYTFKAATPSDIFTAKECLLVHGCMERVSEGSNWCLYDPKHKENYDQLVTIDAEGTSQEHDKDWMHTIVILPGGQHQQKRFFCHNLSRCWGDEGASIRHLGLKSNGQPQCGGYYMRFISRVYKVSLKLKQPKPGARLASAVVTEAPATKKARVE